MANESLSPANRVKAAAETAEKLMKAATKVADKALGEGEAQAVELRTKLKERHLQPPKNATEATLFAEIRSRLEEKPDRFLIAFRSARAGDAETVRAVLTAPAWMWERETGRLSADGRKAIRRAYLQNVAPDELTRLEITEREIAKVQRAGSVLIDRVIRSVDFQTAARLAEAEELSDQASKSARDALRELERAS